MHFLCTNHKNCFPKDFSLGCWITEASKCDLTTRNPDFPDPPEHHCVFFCIFFEHLFFPLFLNIFWILLGPPPPFCLIFFPKCAKKIVFGEIGQRSTRCRPNIFKNVSKKSKKCQNVLFFLKLFWTFFEISGSIWLHLAPSGPIWLHLAPSGVIDPGWNRTGVRSWASWRLTRCARGPFVWAALMQLGWWA